MGGGGGGAGGTHCGLFGLYREFILKYDNVICVFSNIIGGFILLHFNCTNEVPAVGLH